mgnify:CR=1 FL=1
MKFGCFIISSIAVAIIGWVFLSEKDVPTKTVSKITEVAEEDRKLPLEVINQLNNEKKQNDTIEKAKSDYLKNLQPIATRKCSERFLEIASKLPNLIGGSADLAGSNNTKTKNHKIIQSNDFSGNYIHFGVRAVSYTHLTLPTNREV